MPNTENNFFFVLFDTRKNKRVCKNNNKKRGTKMRKCDFCTQSSPSGKCYWSSQPNREYDCKKAIEIMQSVLKRNSGIKKK